MSIQYCEKCNIKIDTDYEAEHFCEECGECVEGRDIDGYKCEHCENDIVAQVE